MAYKFLAPQLHETADAARQFCTQRWGVGATKINVEAPISDEIGFVPTLNARTPDAYILCVEVSTRAYNSTLDSFVLDCKNRGLAVKLYVAIPKDGVEGDFKTDFSRARASGVGLLEIGGAGVTILQEALALSLTGVRAVDTRVFPARYRQAVSDAHHQFVNGNPVKAGSIVYDEVEQLTRRLAARALRKGWWKAGTPPEFDADKEPWANVLKALMNRLDVKAANCPKLKEPLFARAVGVTEHRNDVGHKPKSVVKTQKRDMELRTRFESAIDLLADFVEATKHLRL